MFCISVNRLLHIYSKWNTRTWTLPFRAEKQTISKAAHTRNVFVLSHAKWKKNILIFTFPLISSKTMMKGLPQSCHFAPRSVCGWKSSSRCWQWHRCCWEPAHAITAPTWKGHCSKGYHTLGCSSQAAASSSRGVATHIWHLWDHIWNATSTFRSPQYKRHWHAGLEHLLNWTGLFSLKKRRPRVLIAVYNNLMCMEERALCFTHRWKAKAASWKKGNSQPGKRRKKIPWRSSNPGAGIRMHVWFPLWRYS